MGPDVGLSLSGSRSKEKDRVAVREALLSRCIKSNTFAVLLAECLALHREQSRARIQETGSAASKFSPFGRGSAKVLVFNASVTHVMPEGGKQRAAPPLLHRRAAGRKDPERIDAGPASLCMRLTSCSDTFA